MTSLISVAFVGDSICVSRDGLACLGDSRAERQTSHSNPTRRFCARRRDAVGLHLAEPHGVLGQAAAENVAFLIFAHAFGNAAQLGFKGVHRVAGAEVDSLGIARFVEHRRRAQVLALAAEDGELEHQRGPFEVDFEAVVERPALLIGRAGGRFDEVVVVAVAEDASARIRAGRSCVRPRLTTSSGMPNSRRMKWASWTWRSNSGPPTWSAFQ